MLCDVSWNRREHQELVAGPAARRPYQIYYHSRHSAVIFPAPLLAPIKIPGNLTGINDCRAQPTQGDKAEEQQHVVKYEAVRHPHIMQLYGLVQPRGLCGMVFLNELIPFYQFLNPFKHSRILTTYILAYSSSEWRDYISFPVWIRPATGELSVDLVQDQEKTPLRSDFMRV
ncbi:hypothetical protein DFH08DRAFT_809179 [Mycena albidolilacea]|uniref:Uncharacterized protein n=1 Tax=Mycena albidolilacea TaxID=1033008 RepID=A0AAD7EQL1_9AGAR|nr:hypothetical protein DFH08DRAFT_809179 [Mycena albidolilacea]